MARGDTNLARRTICLPHVLNNRIWLLAAAQNRSYSAQLVFMINLMLEVPTLRQMLDDAEKRAREEQATETG